MIVDVLEVEAGVVGDWLEVGAGVSPEDVGSMVGVCTSNVVTTESVAGRSEERGFPLSCMLLPSADEL